jgi:hypothetical protein
METLDRVSPVVRAHATHLVITPETTWRPDRDGRLVPNAYADRFADLQQALGAPAVAHAIQFSPGTRDLGDFRARWLDRLAADLPRFQYAWVTDHLAVTDAAGRHLALPVAAPAAAGPTVAANLRQLQSLVPDAGVEITATYLRPDDEPALIAGALAPPRTWLVLDLHNVACMASWWGFNANDWIAQLPLDRVIEVHVSGGSFADPAWTKARASRWLDSHDTDVLPAVWELLDRWGPHLTALRALTLERREDTVRAEDVAGIDADLGRLRDVAAALDTQRSLADPNRGPAASPHEGAAHTRSAWSAEGSHAPAPTPTGGGTPTRVASLQPDNDPAPPPAWESALAAALLDPADDAALDDPAWYCRRLIVSLRFNRLIQGSREAIAAWNQDPDQFVLDFKRYHHTVRATARTPWDEAELWSTWRAAEPGGGAP